MTDKWWYGGVLVLAAGITFIAGGLLVNRSTTHASEPCHLEEPKPVDPQVWLYRGLDACESKCGNGIPFDVEVEPLRVRCNCGRPPNLGNKK
jgi:hypothetical protein